MIRHVKVCTESHGGHFVHSLLQMCSFIYNSQIKYFWIILILTFFPIFVYGTNTQRFSAPYYYTLNMRVCVYIYVYVYVCVYVMLLSHHNCFHIVNLVAAMCEPQHLTTLWASMACYRDSFTFTLFTVLYCRLQWPRNLGVVDSSPTRTRMYICDVCLFVCREKPCDGPKSRPRILYRIFIYVITKPGER
jgi:hypothetical protein